MSDHAIENSISIDFLTKVEAAYGAVIAFFQSNYTSNIYAAIYSRAVAKSAEADETASGPDPDKYWKLRFY